MSPAGTAGSKMGGGLTGSSEGSKRGLLKAMEATLPSERRLCTSEALLCALSLADSCTTWPCSSRRAFCS
jgi:hypothetical protein